MSSPFNPEQWVERPADIHDGMIDHEARTAIRALVCKDGFEAAREKIAFYLIDEANRRPRQ